MIRLSLIGILTFFSLFVYFYRKSGNIRRSIRVALVAVAVLISGPSRSDAKGADAYGPKPPQHQTSRRTLSSKPNNPGKPDDNGSGGDDDNGMPQFPQTESVEETENRINRIEEYAKRMEESSSSESEEAQCKLDEEGEETAKEEFEKSIKEEAKLNQQREKYGRSRLTAICKGELKLFAENSHLRDKFHHAPDLDSPIPPTLGIQELNRLSNSNLYEERLKVFRNREILPETYVEQLGRDLRFAVLSPDTTIKKGTFGANLEAAGVSKKIPGYIAYNEETGFCAFFEENGGLYKTSFIANRGQRIDIKKNSNLM